MANRRNFLKAIEPGIAVTSFPGLAFASVMPADKKPGHSNTKPKVKNSFLA